jgi:hypothetical protein
MIVLMTLELVEYLNDIYMDKHIARLELGSLPIYTRKNKIKAQSLD